MKHNHWYLEYKKNPHAAIRLFCFHHSGGGASAYHSWIDLLSPHIELIAIQLPGRETRFTETLTNNLTEIINALSEEFQSYREKPFFLFGHSLGGLIAFEFTKAIHQRYSIIPQHLIVSATKAPHMPFRMKALSSLEDNALKEALKIYNGIDERILQNDELLDLFLPITRSDFSISERYCCKKIDPISCDISLFSGREDQTVNENECNGWKEHTTGQFQHITFSGGHFFIKDHREVIIKMINQIACDCLHQL